jgi:hypothetical protein
MPSLIDKLDVLTTATLRPDILEITLRSFYHRLFRQVRKCRLIINIDPIPEGAGNDKDEIIAISRHWFSDVVVRAPDKPSFPSAVQWLWTQSETDVVFHLEDDWMLRRSVDIQFVAEEFAKHDELAQIALNPRVNRSHERKLSLRPSFIRRKFILDALPLFDITSDPEKQWHRHFEPGGALAHWTFADHGSVGDGHHVREIGALWRKQLNLVKWSPGEVTWKQSSVPLAKLAYFRAKYWCQKSALQILAGPTSPLK